MISAKTPRLPAAASRIPNGAVLVMFAGRSSTANQATSLISPSLPGLGDAALDRPAEDEAQPVASAAQAVEADQVVEGDLDAGLLGDLAHGGLLRALARLEAAAGQAPATAAVGLVHEQHAAVGVEQHDRRSQGWAVGLVVVDQG